MSSVQTSPIGPATAGRRGTMSAADFAKLAAYPAAPLITAVTTGNGLSLAGGTLALAAAGAGAAGAMTAGAQQIDGAKTLTGGLVLSTVEQPLRISPAATGGTSYDKPALWFETTGTNQTYMLTMGSGRTSTTWELAIGYYTGALTPTIQTRASSLLIGLPAGSSMSPFTPNTTDVGSASNYWRNFYGASVIAPASTPLALRSPLGSAAEVVTKIGTSLALASTHASAELLRVACGIGGTESGRLAIYKGSQTEGFELGAPGVNARLLLNNSVGWSMLWAGTNGLLIDGSNTTLGATGEVVLSAPNTRLSATVQLNTTGAVRPAANSSNRGKLWYSKSGAGVTDTLEVCLKDAADAYAWVQIKP